MITPDGWLDWAIRLQPKPPTKNTNPGTNSVKGIFMHSAEGYASVLLDPQSQWGYNGQHSWHLSNLMDGRVFQHYPFTVRCHHATAANQEYVGVENEGYSPRESSLNEAQIANAIRFITEISEWKGWTPTRTGDKTQTLWEHREVGWLGGVPSSCPSGRIPWSEILTRLSGERPVVIAPVAEEEDMYSHYAWATWFTGREIAAGPDIYTAQLRADFSLPLDAKSVLLQPVLDRGSTEWFHGNSDIPGVRMGNAFLVLLDEQGTANFQVTTDCRFRRLQCVGYYK